MQHHAPDHSPRPRAVRRRGRVPAGIVAALSLAVAAALGPAPASPTSDPVAPAVPLVRPNVVLILTDDQTMDAIPRMPYISSRADWHTFTHAYVNTSLCCPARATTLTGQYDTHTGVTNNGKTGLFRDGDTLGVWLQQAGYRTGFFGKYFNGYPWKFGKASYVPPGWSDWRGTFGAHEYTQYNYKLNENGVVRSFGATPADYLVDVLRQRAVSFVRTTTAGKPLFLYFSPTSTHKPWNAAPRHVDDFKGFPMPRYPNANEADVSDKPAWVRALRRLDLNVQDNKRRRAWEGALAIDEAVQAIDAALLAEGRLDDTVLIFTSDNGYSFGSHRWEVKRCEYEECHHVPLLIRYPGQPAQVDDRLVGNIDLAPTIADLADTTPGISMDGRSLVPLLTGGVVNWRTGLLQHWAGGDDTGGTTNQPVPASWGIRTRDYRYVELATGERELYDLRTDPYELRNVAGTPAYADVQADLRARLDVLKAGAD